MKNLPSHMCTSVYHSATMLKIGPSTFLEDEDEDMRRLRSSKLRVCTLLHSECPTCTMYMRRLLHSEWSRGA